MVRSEHVVGLLSCALEDDDHEGSHKEGAVHHLVWLIGGAVVEDAIRRVVLVLKESGQLSTEPVDHRQVQRTKVLVEREVGQVIVDVEEERILVVLRWFGVRDPVQFVYND